VIKIGILNQGSKFNWGHNFGYWYFILFFKEELIKSGYQITFYNEINKVFLRSDLIFINSRFFTDSIFNRIKKKINLHSNNNLVEKVKAIHEKNNNIVWFDLSDSAGNTQFEILPYVKKYVKKQVYKDREMYKKIFFRNRYYSDYYHKKFNVENFFEPYYCTLKDEYIEKLVLGWNIGVGNYFNILDHNSYLKYKCIFEAAFKSNHKELFRYTLNYHNNENKSENLFYSFNLRSTNSKQAVHFQRNNVHKILSDNYPKTNKGRLSHKNFLLNLMNSKISVGSFGWGEICYREYEATKMGAAIIFPNIDYIETWPNIFKDGETFMSYNLDLSNLLDVVEKVLSDDNLRSSLVYNAQDVCQNVYKEDGLNYLLNFFEKIKN
tara:strand:+ start:170 stop:1306 length:1137 start_codon:yes stop_codon:yes gene_type:complete